MFTLPKIEAALRAQKSGPADYLERECILNRLMENYGDFCQARRAASLPALGFVSWMIAELDIAHARPYLDLAGAMVEECDRRARQGPECEFWQRLAGSCRKARRMI